MAGSWRIVALDLPGRGHATDRPRHRSQAGVTHPFPSRQTRHSLADFSGPIPAGDRGLRLESIHRQDPERGEPAPQFEFDQTVSW